MAAESSDRGSSETESSKTGLSNGTTDPVDSAASGATSTPARTEAESSSATTDAEPADFPTAASDAAPVSSDESDDQSAEDSSGYPPALIATAVALPVVLVVAVLVAAVLAHRAPTEREPLVLGPVPAPAADGPACTALLPALPVDLGDYSKSTLVEPAPPATRAWQRKDGGEAIVLRCGLERPLEFNRASPLQIVNGVQWFEVRDATAKASTWFAVDRATYIALTVPDGSGPTPLQGVSDTITAKLPAQPIDPGPLPN